MAEIFISYKSERRAAAAHLAKIIERYGYTVWFDYHLAKGDDFADEIDRRIREAKALVVLWCKLAVQSVWVRREAALGTRLGILVPAMVEPCELRVDFASDDYTDLSGWSGAPLDRKLFPLLDGIAHRVGRPPQLDFMAMREYEENWHRFGAPSLKAFALDAPVKAQEATQPKPLPAFPNSALPDTRSASVPISQAAHGHPYNQAVEDWKLIEHSADPRDFRAFIEEHRSGLLVRKARHKLEDLAEAAFAAAGRDKAGLERFLRVHFESTKVEPARVVLAEIAAEARKAAGEPAERVRLVEEQLRWQEAESTAVAELVAELESRRRAEIIVTTLGESVTEAVVGKWLKKLGDAVNAGECLAELETDSATLEVNAPASGIISKVIVKEGEMIAPGAVLGVINEKA
jgi:biotin carboxyl carrier protein